jgi:Domain of unknown function (DUF1707)
VPVTTGPQDPAAGRDRLRAGHADREQAIETLKTAFVDGRLTRSELAARTGRALAARTYADLARLTADIPAEPAAVVPVRTEPTPAESAVARPGPTHPPAPAVRRPLAKAAAVSGACLVFAAAAVEVGAHIDPNVPGPNPHHAWVAASFSLALVAVIIAAFTVFLGVAVAIEQRRSRRQPPPRSGPGGRALDRERHDGAGRDPGSPGPRTDQTRTDVRARTSRPTGRRITARSGLAPGGVMPGARRGMTPLPAAWLTVDVQVDAQQHQEPEEDREQGAGYGAKPCQRDVVVVPGDEHPDGDVYEEEDPADPKHVR